MIMLYYLDNNEKKKVYMLNTGTFFEYFCYWLALDRDVEGKL